MSTAVAAVELPTLAHLLRRAAQTFRSSEIVFPSERCTFAELDDRADTFHDRLRAAGVRPGDQVGVWLPTGIESIAALFGTFRAGAVAVPISDRYRRNEIGHVVTQADIAVLLVGAPTGHVDRAADLLDAFPELQDSGPDLALAAAPRLRRVVQIEGRPTHSFTTSTSALGRASDDAARANEVGELAYLMFTSGTSASPKACMITHAGCLLQAQSLAHERYLLDPDCAFWCPLPLFHTAGLATLGACLASGASFVHAGTFDATQAIRAIEAERITHAVPAFETIWLRILDHPEFADRDLSRLRVIVMSGGEEQLRALQARTPWATQITNYGMTESTGHLSMNHLDETLSERTSTTGHPLPEMEVRVVDLSTGELCTPGEPGEIQFRGPSRCLGYYGDLEASRAATAEGGWFRSGDLGTLDTNGRLTFRGREKDMLKVGGENVASLEVESFLARHPAINIVAVVGAPDTYYGEVPVAYVETTPGSELTADEVIAFCVDSIATFKVPRYVRFIHTWPMSGTKIQKFVLRERIARELADSGITEAPRLVSKRSPGRSG